MRMEPEEEDYQSAPAPPREADPSEEERRAAKERMQAGPTPGQRLAGKRSYVTLGGERYPFVVDVRSVIALEAKYGSMQALGVELEKGAHGKMFTAVTDLLSACVRELPPGVDVVDLMQFDQFESYGAVVLQGLEATGLYVPPEQQGNGSGNGSAPMRGQPTGTRSSTKPSPSGTSRRKRSSR